MRIRDPGWRQLGSGMEKSRIRAPDKHPGSTTLHSSVAFHFVEICDLRIILKIWGFADSQNFFLGHLWYFVSVQMSQTYKYLKGKAVGCGIPAAVVNTLLVSFLMMESDMSFQLAGCVNDHTTCEESTLENVVLKGWPGRRHSYFLRWFSEKSVECISTIKKSAKIDHHMGCGSEMFIPDLFQPRKVLLSLLYFSEPH